MFTGTEGDGVDHVAHVGFEPCGDVDGAQSSLETSDFVASSDELVLELLLSGVAGVKFLAGGQGVVVYGGDESVGDGMDGLINVGVSAQQDFGGVWRYWGKFLVIFLEGGGEAKRQGVLCRDVDMGELGGGGFGKGGELLHQGDKAGDFIGVLVH